MTARCRRDLAAEARGAGVALSIETHHASLADTGAATLRLGGMVDDDRVGVNPDLVNVHWAYATPEGDWRETLRRLAPHANLWHVKSVRRIEVELGRRAAYIGTSLGEGDIDHRWAVARMRQAGLDGWVSIERGGGGIGEGIVELLVEGGAAVVVADMNEEAGLAQRDRLSAAGHAAEFVRTDVAVEADVAAAARHALDRSGRVDILVDDAGWKRAGLARTLSEEDLNRSMAIHLNGTWLTVRHLVPSMVGDGGGAVVNISPMQALLGLPGRAAYSAAKGAISALARRLAVEYGPAHVRVNAVPPGAIPTGRKLQNQAADFSGDRMALAPKAYPLRRFGTPRDIANAVCFLASDDADWITGVNLPVDGGGLVQLGEALIPATDEAYWNELAALMPS